MALSTMENEMNEKFIQGKYAAARYSKKKIGIGVAGESAFCYVTPREGEEFTDELRRTIQLMKTAPEMYEMLEVAVGMFSGTEFSKRAKQLLAKARGEV